MIRKHIAILPLYRRANHFTVLVNDLTTFKNLLELNAFLKSNGFKLNSAGGEVKGSREVFLEQSSTLADIAEKVAISGFKSPAVTVIGEVVKLRDRLRWWDNRGEKNNNNAISFPYTYFD